MNKLFSILLLTVILILGGCEHKELCYDHRHNVELEVVFDWSKSPGGSPYLMDLYLLPEGGGRTEHYQFGRNRNSEITGGKISVPIGRYRAICLNSDSETNMLRGTDSWESFEVYTITGSLLSTLSASGVRADEPPRAEGTDDERVAYAPDGLLVGIEQNLQLTVPGNSYRVTFTPENALCNYTVRVVNVTNLKYTQGVSGTLSSMAGGLLAGNGELTDERVIMSFNGKSDWEVSTITGTFHVFGHCPAVPNPHWLTIYAVLSDGRKIYKSYDVTDQVHNAPDPRNVEILIDGLELPKPITNGSGFQPGVDNWQDGEDIEIEL